MNIYEGMFLVDNRKANRDWDAVTDHVRGILERSHGSLQRLHRWGERKLAYPIKKHNRGVYLLAYFEVPEESTQAVSEIYRQVEISDTILRAIIFRIREIPAEIVPGVSDEEAAEPAEEGAAPGSEGETAGEEEADGEAAEEETTAAAAEEGTSDSKVAQRRDSSEDASDEESQ